MIHDMQILKKNGEGSLETDVTGILNDFSNRAAHHA